jgi:hypothetical protein
MTQEHWQSAPEEHDFPAAATYLSLLMPQLAATPLVNALRSAPTVHYQAKDLLRASRLPLLKKTNAHVASDLAKIRGGVLLSPVLLGGRERGHTVSGRGLGFRCAAERSGP